MAFFYDARCDHGMHASAVHNLADLPEEVLLLVMERVPLLARLRCCSLVCRSMHKAAAAATLSIKVPSGRPTAAASADRSASLQLYLQYHGHQLTGISMEQEELCFPDQSLQETVQQQQRLLTRLSCSKLQELVLSGGELQPAVLHAPAATLTKLILQSSEAQPVQLVQSPTAGQTDVWYSTPGVVLYDEWSEGSKSDAESDAAGDPAESVDEGAPSSLQASSAPLGQQFYKALQHLSGLKHLQLDYCSDGTRATMFGKALPYLTHLTHLKLWWYCVDFKPWRQHLSCLTDLRVLALYTNMEQSQGLLEDLDQHSLLADEVLEGVQHLQRLTELRVEGLCLAVTAHSSSTLGRLTGLQVLQLSYASCDLSALAAITALRSLSLQHWAPNLKLRHDAPERFWRPEHVSKQQLQATLLQLEHLTYFRIDAASMDFDDDWWHYRGRNTCCALEAVDDYWELPPAPWSHYHWPNACASDRSDECEACQDVEQSIVGFNAVEIGASFTPQPGMEVFAAFTASSCLQHLDLSNAVLQFHTWQHMFPAGRTLLQLRCLQAPYALYYPGQFDCLAESDLVLTDAHVAAMVSCCPALQALEATNVLQLSDKPHLGNLQHLTRLEAIWGSEIFTVWDSDCDGEHVDVWGQVDKAAAARELSRLVNLRQLKLRGEDYWGEDLSRALQHLSHLTSLCLSGTATYTTSNRGREELSVGEAGLIARLTGLQELDVRVCLLHEAQLLQLASLPQLTRLCFSPAPMGCTAIAALVSGRDMSNMFEEAVKSFKGGSAGSDMQHLQYRACIIESKECCAGPCEILHQLVQQLCKVHQQQETTLTDLRSNTAQQQKELRKNKKKLARLVQELSHTKSVAEQRERERNAAVEAAAEHQKQLQEKDQQLAQLHQQLAEFKASAEQRDAAARRALESTAGHK